MLREQDGIFAEADALSNAVYSDLDGLMYPYLRMAKLSEH